MINLTSAVRQLSRSPGFAAVAVLTLSLGIGLSAGAFSIANAFLLRNVPYPDADRLVRIYRVPAQSQPRAHSPANALDIRDAVTSYSSVALFNYDNIVLVEPGQPAQQINGVAVTAEFFKLLGVQPALGRAFVAGEDQPEAPRGVVLTDRGWRRYFGGDPAVLGRSLRLNADTYTVIGVLPPSFEALLVWGAADVFLPRTIMPDYRTNRSGSWVNIIGRLKPGVSVAMAQAEVDPVAARLRQAFPKENRQDVLSVVDLSSSNMDSISRALLWLMTGLALTMLLIACANLASLQVARAFGRSREFAVRAALGGSRSQLMAPLLVESFLLSAAGGLGGLFVASWSNDLIGQQLRINNEVGFHIPLDLRVFAFAVFASLLSGLAFGLAPALLTARAAASDALKEGSRGATATRSHQRWKNGLIITELALALALVAIAASFGFGTKSFLHRRVGWDYDGVLNGSVTLPYSVYNDNAKNRTFQRQLLERLHQLPGVASATIATGVPFFSLGATVPVFVESEPVAEAGREPVAESVAVSPDYFGVLRIPLLRGNVFAATLTENDGRVCVVNEAFAKRFWPDGDAIGHRVRVGQNGNWAEIIGVVADVKMLGRFDTPPTRLQIYRPLIQEPGRYLTIAIRTPLDPAALVEGVRRAIAEVDPELPLQNAMPMRALFAQFMANIDLVIMNLGLSAGMGLLIATIGVFGVVSQLIAQRTRDIGVRMALGAQPGDIVRMILSQGMRYLVVGVALGIPLYIWLHVFVRQVIPEMALPGAASLAANVLVLCGAMLIACWLPAVRAVRLNPVDALRAE